MGAYILNVLWRWCYKLWSFGERYIREREESYPQRDRDNNNEQRTNDEWHATPVQEAVAMAIFRRHDITYFTNNSETTLLISIPSFWSYTSDESQFSTYLLLYPPTIKLLLDIHDTFIKHSVIVNAIYI